MTMSYLLTLLFLCSLVFSLLTGRSQELATASLTGAQDALELCLSMAGILCLWTGIMEVLRQCGLADQLARGLSPLLRRLYPDASPQALGSIAANVSANLLGLGNAATPLGIQAAQALGQGCNGVASHSLCLLVVCNTASIQLIPSTVTALRAATGSQNPMEILPAVWLTSLGALTLGILACQICGRLWWIWEGPRQRTGGPL